MDETRFAEHEVKNARFVKLKAEVLPHNRQVLFEALVSAGIESVTVNFDGYGDSGAFEQPMAFGPDNTEVALPLDTIAVKEPVFDTGEVDEHNMTVHDFIEWLASDFLEENHSGWEDGEGAYGEFHFSAADRSIKLEYSERYVDTHYHEHEF